MKFALTLLAGGVVMVAAGVTPSKDQADVFEKKLVEIVKHGAENPDTPRRTSITENEVNSYLRFKGDSFLPVGVTDPSIVIHGAGRLSGRAVVDLDQVREKKGSGSLLDPTTYLMGKLPVTAAGTLHTRAGAGRFELESCAISGVPIPKSFLQEIVSYYTRSADHPNGVSIDQVFELPANIDEIQVGQGNAIVVQ
jgi:hypothetical protein